jgi:hypothetical protein
MSVRDVIFSTSVVALVSLALLPSKASALDSPKLETDDEAARNVVATCEKQLKLANGAETFDLGICLGVIKGLHYLSTDICIPPALGLADIAGVLSKYFDSHAEESQADFRERSLHAMRAAWPCGFRKVI